VGPRSRVSIICRTTTACAAAALALAHAKSGDAATIAGYCGKSDVLDEAIGKFAMSYAKQTEQDYEAFASAKRTGRIKVAIEPSH
jgi:hypothetical protein